MTTYEIVPNTKFELKIKVYYNKGGYSYSTYKEEPRGYYLSVSPVERETKDNYTTESYVAFSGVKKLILPVERQSQKSFDQAVELAKSSIPELKQYVLNGMKERGLLPEGNAQPMPNEGNRIITDLKDFDPQTTEIFDGDADFSEFPSITDLGVLLEIKGYADFRYSQVKSLGNLQTIGGMADFRDSQVQDLGNLQTIGGYALFSDSELRSLGNLQTIGGGANFKDSQVKSLGNLQTIGEDADFENSQVQSLGNLQKIGGDAWFTNSELQDLGNLQTIGGRADFGTQIQSLGNLQTIGGTASFGDSQIQSLGNLQTIGRDAFFSDSQVQDLGNLQTIGRDAYFSDSQVKNLGDLQTIRGKIIWGKRTDLKAEWENRQGNPEPMPEQDEINPEEIRAEIEALEAISEVLEGEDRQSIQEEMEILKIVLGNNMAEGGGVGGEKKYEIRDYNDNYVGRYNDAQLIEWAKSLAQYRKESIYINSVKDALMYIESPDRKGQQIFEVYHYAKGGGVVERNNYAEGGLVRNPNKNDFKSKFEWFLENNNNPVSKGNLIKMAYENTTGVDTAIPQNLWGDVDDTYFYVYDYQNSAFGELVDLRMKLKWSNVYVDVTIVKNGEVLYKDDLPYELANPTFHQALNYIWTNADSIEAFDIRPRSEKYAKGGGVGILVDKLYAKSDFINDQWDWQLKLLELLQDNSVEAYRIYMQLNDEEKESVLKELYEIDNEMGSEGDGTLETSAENLQILLEGAKNGKRYAKGGGVDYFSSFDFNKKGNLEAKINGKKYEIIYRDLDAKGLSDNVYELFENGKMIKSDKNVRNLMIFEGNKYAKGGGVEIPKNKSLRHFILNEMSAGMIANRVPYSDYATIDEIRIQAVQILNRDGDREYSLQSVSDLIQEALLEYEENKSEMNFAIGGGVGELPPKGELTNKDNFLLKYEKKGGDYEFYIYKPETKKVSRYNQVKHICVNSDCPHKMTYEQFINYLYAELYLDDIKYAKGGGVEIPKNKSLRHFILNEMSAGMIANRVPYSDYATIDEIRIQAVQILNRDGDREYSLQSVSDLIQEALLEYEENKSEMNFANGGGVDFFDNLPFGGEVAFETQGDYELEIDDFEDKLKILHNHIKFDEVYGESDNYETDLKFYKNGEIVASLKGTYNENLDTYDCELVIDGYSSYINFHPLDTLGDLDLQEFNSMVANAVDESQTFSAVVSIEGYEVDGQEFSNKQNAEIGIKELKEKTNFYLVRGKRFGQGKRIEDGKILRKYKNGGEVFVCPVGTEIQTLIFDKSMFNLRQAKAWAKKNKFDNSYVDGKLNTFRIRQKDPKLFVEDGFRTIQLRQGVQAVIGCPKRKIRRKR